MAFTDGNIIIGTSVDVGGLNTGLNKIQKAFGRIGRLSAAILGVGMFAKISKDAINAASNLQEVQNIVDVAFGDMAYKIENFSKTCIDFYGMSELAAKQTAGSFMAMGNAMGLSAEDASDMAVQLTALSGDFASFFNISQEYAKVALSAVYTGETETLKRYGIVLTEANLQQYANTLGIQQSVKSMSARNKLALRYNYIMEATKQAEGDFLRTQNSWANQVRVLQQQWNRLMIVLGKGIITVLTPLIKVLNSLIEKLIHFSKTIGAILTDLFGIQWQDSASSSFENVTEGIEDATEAQEELTKATEKYLSPLDEISRYKVPGSDQDSSALDLDIDLGDLENPEVDSAIDQVFDKVSSLFELGEYIGNTIREGLERIDWDKIYSALKSFGTGLAEFLNGLISPELFGTVAATIAKALNAAIYGGLAFATTFDWTDLGMSIANAVNTFFATFDFKAFAESINKWVQGIYTTLKTAVQNIDWDLVWEKIKEFFSSLDKETYQILIGALVLKGIKKLVLGFSLSKLLSKAVGPALLKAFKDLFANFSLAGLKQSIGTFVSKLFTNIGKFFTTKLPMLVSSLKGGFSVLFHNLSIGNSLNTSLTAAFGGAATTISGIASVVGGAVMAVVNFFNMLKDGFSWLNEILMVVGTALAAVGAIILGAPALVAGVVAAIVSAVGTAVVVIKDNWESICEFFGNICDSVAGFFSEAWGYITEVWADVSGWFSTYVIEPISSFFEGLCLRIGQFFEGCWLIIQAVWMIVSDWFNTNIIQPLTEMFTRVTTSIGQFFQNLWEGICNVWNKVSAWFDTNIIQPLTKFFTDLKERVSKLFTDLWTDIKNVWSGVSGWFSTTIIQPLTNAFKTATDRIKGFFQSLWNSIAKGLKDAVNGALSGIESAINWLSSAVNKVVSGFNKVASWAANVVGKDWGGVSLIPSVSIPRLATGAVIPPNKEFMAVLGDQTKGTNIETPENLLRQIIREELGSNSSGTGPITFVAQLDGRTLFKQVISQAELSMMASGNNPFALA